MVIINEGCRRKRVYLFYYIYKGCGSNLYTCPTDTGYSLEVNRFASAPFLVKILMAVLRVEQIIHIHQSAL